MHLNSLSSYFIEKNYLSILEACYVRLPERLITLISLAEFSLIKKKKKKGAPTEITTTPLSESNPKQRTADNANNN